MNPIKFQGCVWESTSRYQDKIIYNPNMLQSISILSRWKNSPTQHIEVDNLELIANLVNEGAGYGIIPTQVVLSQRFNLKKVKATPSFSDILALVCYPEMLKSEEGRLVFEVLKKSFKS